jgi:hypothetical protein
MNLNKRKGKIVEDLSDRIGHYKKIISKIKDSIIRKEMRECLGQYEYDILKLETYFAIVVKRVIEATKDSCIAHIKEELKINSFADMFYKKKIENLIKETKVVTE